MAKSKLLEAKNRIEAFTVLGDVVFYKSAQRSDKWNALAYEEVLRMCDEKMRVLSGNEVE